MKKVVLFALMLATSSIVLASDPPLIPVIFAWPNTQPNVVPDLRVKSAVTAAEDQARHATSLASEGRRAAAHAKRRTALRSIIGIKPSRSTLDDDTEIASSGRSASNGSTLGTMTYDSGARMTGEFGSNLGVYEAGPESPLLQFSGFVWGASSPNPHCSEGLFEWRNGDTFAGSIVGDGSSSEGIYTDATGERRFVGVVDLSESDFRPVRGYVLDKGGRLLATVRAR